MSTDDNPIAAFHKDTESAQPQQVAGRSAADDIIEVVGELRRAKPRGGCPQCGSGEVITTRPLGAAPRNRCADCKHKWLGAPRSPAPLVLAKNGPSQTATSGPYYRGRVPLPKTDKNAPKSRRKGKSLSALKEKLK